MSNGTAVEHKKPMQLERSELLKKQRQKDSEIIQAIVDKYDCDKKSVLAILLEIQAEYGYLSKVTMARVSKRLKISIVDLYKIATIYNEFRFTPTKKQRIKVCHCSTCYVNKVDQVLEAIERVLGIKPGETTADGEYTLEVVDDITHHPSGPFLKVGDETHNNITPKEAVDLFLKKELILIIQPYEEKAKEEMK